MKEEVKNLYIAIMLSVLVIFGVNYFFPTPKETPQNDIIVTPEVESTETIVTNENLTEEKKERVIFLLEKYGLKDFINKYPSSLSGGMKQRVACI